MTLEGLLSDITPEKVSAHLIGREPDLLDDVDEEPFENIVISAATEVLRYVDPDQDGILADLAIDAITLETASRIEYSLFPEQQSAGDSGRGFYLHRIYLERLVAVRAHPDARSPIRPQSVVHDMSSYDPTLCPDFPEVI